MQLSAGAIGATPALHRAGAFCESGTGIVNALALAGHGVSGEGTERAGETLVFAGREIVVLLVVVVVFAWLGYQMVRRH